MNRNPEGVLAIIFDIQKIYMEYLDQANEADKQYVKIRIQKLDLEQDLYISNKENEQAVMLLQE